MNSKEKKLVDSIIEICEELNWSIAIPQEEGEEDIKGLIIGTPDYIDALLPREDLPEEDIMAEYLPKNTKKDSVH